MKKKLEELKAKLAALKERIEADDADAIAEGVKLKGEIETINMSGEIPALTAEIADFEADLEHLLGTTTERTPEIIALENKIAAKKKTLENKEKDKFPIHLKCVFRVQMK